MLPTSAKHGIDFVEAQALWKDLNYLEFDTRFVSEKRILTIGKISDKFWTAVTTLRDRRIRIISVRRSRKNEEKFYVQKTN